MRIIKRALSLILLVVFSLSLLVGCSCNPLVPKDAVEFRPLSVKVTYNKEENNSTVTIVFDLLNGKERDIESYTMDFRFYLKDGSNYEHSVDYEKRIDYSLSQPHFLVFNATGNVDEIELLGYEVEMANYWSSFKGLIFSSCAIFLVIGLIFVAFLAADMSGWLSVGSAGVVLFDIAMLLFLPFVESIILILASALAFIPMLIYNWIENY